MELLQRHSATFFLLVLGLLCTSYARYVSEIELNYEEERIDKLVLTKRVQAAIEAAHKIIENLQTLTGILEVMVQELPKIDQHSVPGRIQLQNTQSTISQLEVYLKLLQSVDQISDLTDDVDIPKLKARAEKDLEDANKIIDEMKQLTGMLEVMILEIPRLDQDTFPGKLELDNIKRTVDQLERYIRKWNGDDDGHGTTVTTPKASTSTHKPSFKYIVLAKYRDLASTINAKLMSTKPTGQLLFLQIEVQLFEFQVNDLPDEADHTLLDNYLILANFLETRINPINFAYNPKLIQDDENEEKFNQLLTEVTKNLTDATAKVKAAHNGTLEIKLQLIDAQIEEMRKQVPELIKFLPQNGQKIIFAQNGFPSLLKLMQIDIKKIVDSIVPHWEQLDQKNF